MRVLITGGSGYIGSALCQKMLSCDSFEIYNYDLVNGEDISNLDQLLSVMTSFHPEVVIHLAALSDIPRCNSDYKTMINYNIIGVKNILEAMVKCQVSRLLFASSCAVYKESSYLLEEDFICRPTSNYGYSKLLGEHIIESYSSRYPQLKCTMLRFFNIAGYNPYFKDDHRFASHSRLLPLSEDKPFTIFGTNYNTSDGTAIRDYVYIDDLVHILIFITIVKNQKTGIFNIASGKGVSVYEVLLMYHSIFGYPTQVYLGDRRYGDMEKVIGNSDKLYKKYGLKVDHNIKDIVTSYKDKEHN